MHARRVYMQLGCKTVRVLRPVKRRSDDPGDVKNLIAFEEGGWKVSNTPQYAGTPPAALLETARCSFLRQPNLHIF